MRIPKCYDAVRQFELRDRIQARKERQSPHCQCCDFPIQTETALDLRPFGLGLVCQRCVDRHIRYEEVWLDGGAT